MQFTDEVTKVCEVVIEGCPTKQVGGFGGDMRLGSVVIDLLYQAGYDVSALEVETLDQYFAVVCATQNKITVRRVAVP